MFFIIALENWDYRPHFINTTKTEIELQSQNVNSGETDSSLKLFHTVYLNLWEEHKAPYLFIPRKKVLILAKAPLGHDSREKSFQWEVQRGERLCPSLRITPSFVKRFT